MDLRLGTFAPHEEGIFLPSAFDDAVIGMEQQIRKMYPSKVPTINETNEARQRELMPFIKPWLKSYIDVAMNLGRGMNLNYLQDAEFNQALRAKSGLNFFQNAEMGKAFTDARKYTTLVSEAIYAPKGYFEKYPDEKLDTTDKVLNAVGAGASKVLWIAMFGLIGYGVIMSSPRLFLGWKKALKK
jgi:hypothetical protein